MVVVATGRHRDGGPWLERVVLSSPVGEWSTLRLVLSLLWAAVMVGLSTSFVYDDLVLNHRGEVVTALVTRTNYDQRTPTFNAELQSRFPGVRGTRFTCAVGFCGGRGSGAPRRRFRTDARSPHSCDHRMLVTNIPSVVSRAERTRERLLTAALELFTERGYDATSVGDIAARAGVTEMTCFRHFPSKASLLVDDPYDPLIGAFIRGEPTSLDPITRAARGVRAAWRQVPPPSIAEVRIRLRIVARTPALRASIASGTAATEAVIASALADGATARTEAMIAASAVMGALNTALLEWSMTDNDDLGQAIENALNILEDRHG
ncbi:TetR/AcrR family transcriptional regulator [Kribbella sp. NPDC004138]